MQGIFNTKKPLHDQRLAIDFCGLRFKNPILSSSGTFGNGMDFSPFLDVSQLGGLTLKALTIEPRKGNPHPRVCETEAGMINSIGLQNQGWEYFQTQIYPRLFDTRTRVIVNIAGNKLEDYVHLVTKLKDFIRVDIIELNVSCPNVDAGKILFGADPKNLSKLVQACVKANRKSQKPLIVKLSPNVTDITEMAMVCEKAGADGLSISNTFIGMRINIHEKRPMIKNVMGGYSGPGIKPIVLRMVYEVAQISKLPILAIGGVSKYQDALEYLMAGATLVSVGTANLIDPKMSGKILKGFRKYMKKNNLSTKELIGSLEIDT